MNQPDRIEFYSKGKCILRIDSSIVPAIGSMVSIKKVTWEVINVSYAVDYSDSVFERYMCANIAVKKVIE